MDDSQDQELLLRDGGDMDPKARNRANRKKKGVEALSVYFWGIWLALAVEGMIASVAYYVPIVFVAAAFGVFLAIMVGIIAWAIKTHSSSRKAMWLASSLVLAGASGYVGGVWGGFWVRQYYSTTYRDVRTWEDPAAYKNLEMAYFHQESFVNEKLAGIYKDPITGASFCAAPMVNTEGTPPLNVAFWAVAKDCCTFDENMLPVVGDCWGWDIGGDSGNKQVLEGELWDAHHGAISKAVENSVENSKDVNEFSSAEDAYYVELLSHDEHLERQSFRKRCGLIIASVWIFCWPIFGLFALVIRYIFVKV